MQIERMPVIPDEFLMIDAYEAPRFFPITPPNLLRIAQRGDVPYYPGFSDSLKPRLWFNVYELLELLEQRKVHATGDAGFVLNENLKALPENFNFSIKPNQL